MVTAAIVIARPFKATFYSTLRLLRLDLGGLDHPIQIALVKLSLCSAGDPLVRASKRFERRRHRSTHSLRLRVERSSRLTIESVGRRRFGVSQVHAPPRSLIIQNSGGGVVSEEGGNVFLRRTEKDAC